MKNNTIDIHTHILPPEIPRFKEILGEGGFIQLEHLACGCKARMLKDDGTFFREVDSNCWDGEKRIEECDKHNVGRQVLSTVPVMFSYWAKPENGLYVAKYVNNHIASLVKKYPERFIGLGTLPLQDISLSLKELKRCKDLGLVGVEIGSHIGEFNLDHKRFYPLYKALQDLNMCLFVHPWDMMGKSSMEKYWLPWLVGMPAESSRALCSLIFGGIFDRYPQLRIAIAHGGGSFPSTLGRIDHGYKVRPDLCAVNIKKTPRDYLGKFWVDSLVHDEKVLANLVELVGADKVAMGSDYPFPLGEHLPGKLIKDHPLLTKDQKEKLLYKSALSWLNMKE